MLMTACSRVGNYEHAYFEQHGATYLVELKGTRRLMAHDPISALRGRTYEETLTMQLPRIEGVVQGSEIPVPPDKLRYTGRIVLTSGTMKVELFYDNPDSSTRVALPWNGDYTLVQRK
jgi:hypothetical protein